jgi:signal transduction histidine kinase
MFSALLRPRRGCPALRDYRRLFEALPDAVLVLCADPPFYTIVDASDAYLRATLTKRDGPDGIIGRPLFAALPVAPRASDADGVCSLRASLDRVVASGSPDSMATEQYAVRRPDGSWEERYWSPINVPVADHGGHVDYVLHTVVDVTDMTRLAQRATAAERASAAAAEANAIKARFLASMSHELRTPLNAIGGYVDLIAMGLHGPVTHEQAKALERIRQSEKHLLGLVNEVLDYAKIESGHVAIEREIVSLAPVIDDVISLGLPQMNAKGLHLIVGPTVVDGCELEVVADRERIRQILLNLLSNATKFTPAGGRIQLDCGADGRWATITVSDTGVGMRPADLARIFEPFVQVGSREASAAGTGLGLSISRELARAMGGDITARSTLGRGASFTLRLPRSNATERRGRRSA